MPQHDPRALLKDGMARHQAGDLDGAERLYRKAAASRPADADAHNLLGVVARQRGDARAALRHTGRALALQPEAPVFLANHGGALAEAGELREAVGFFRAALRRRPEDPVALRNLGQALAALGDAGSALEPLGRAAALDPDAPEPRLALAHARREVGDAEGAAAAAEAALARSAPDSALAAQARFLLAALGRAAVPDRAPTGYVRDLFDGFAERFDADLAGGLGYRTPELLAATLRDAGAPAGEGRGLDLGCGTGLSGLALAPLVRRLEGLDLSPRMLALARRRGVYAALHQADLLEWLPGHPAAFDLVAAADVLNYLGDLRPALAGIAGALRPGGFAAFSLEAGEGNGGAPFALGATMRYRHDRAHAAALAAEAFEVVSQSEATLRQERGAPVAGVLMVLRRRGRGG
ncbi:methyltransferase domain-containing protein [Craurococcus roseus]|uniref:methyltransferase domain-containing protein n=1 Tax=Craurococcus roseus TaxID=77585 RepID=UPI0031E3F3E9